MSLQPMHVRSEALELDASAVPWDSESFGVPVAQIDAIKVHNPQAAAAHAAPLLEWLRENRVKLAACRLPHDALAESFLLESIGFRFVETVYAMAHDVGAAQAAGSDDPALAWAPAAPADLAALRTIAAASFTTGRWNVDWRVGPQAGGRRYADWVSRSLTDERHQVLVARAGGILAGFFIVEDRPEQRSYWHLTAVAQELQGRGWGRRIWRSMLQRQRLQGVRTVETTISARNLPVVNLYARLGWRFARCHMTYHWVSPDLADGAGLFAEAA